MTPAPTTAYDDLPNEPPAPPGLPPRAGWLAIAGLAVGVLLGLALGAVGAAIAPRTIVVQLVLSQFGLWAGLFGCCVVASRRYGTRSLGRDFGLRARLGDLPRGIALAVGVRLLSGAVVAVLIAVNPSFANPDANPLQAVGSQRGALIAISLFAAVGAPVVEELFFRGLVLGVLRSLVGVPLAVVLQAALFGLAHARPAYGLASVAVVAGTATFGIVQGVVVQHWRRLGPATWTHAFFNLAAVGILLSGVGK